MRRSFCLALLVRAGEALAIGAATVAKLSHVQFEGIPPTGISGTFMRTEWRPTELVLYLQTADGEGGDFGPAVRLVGGDYQVRAVQIGVVATLDAGESAGACC